MSASWVPPRRAYHLRVFAVGLGLIVIGLAVFLLGVRMEAVEPATGIITARDLRDVRSLLPGLILPGWYESEIADVDGQRLQVRMNDQGDGLCKPALDKGSAFTNYQVGPGIRISAESRRFHRLQAGDELWPGQLLASVRTEEWHFHLKQIEDRLRQWKSSGNHGAEIEHARAEAEALRHQIAQAQLHVPDSGQLWMVVQVRVAPLQAVQSGDVIASIVPIDPTTHHPLDLIARLEVDEKHCCDLELGQTIRLFSEMYNHRLYGHAEAMVERIEPWGEATADGRRRYVVFAPVTASPFPLALGSSVKAEIVVGRKVVYRIILEH